MSEIEKCYDIINKTTNTINQLVAAKSALELYDPTQVLEINEYKKSIAECRDYRHDLYILLTELKADIRLSTISTIEVKFGRYGTKMVDQIKDDKQAYDLIDGKLVISGAESKTDFWKKRKDIRYVNEFGHVQNIGIMVLE